MDGIKEEKFHLSDLLFWGYLDLIEYINIRIMLTRLCH